MKINFKFCFPNCTLISICGQFKQKSNVNIIILFCLELSNKHELAIADGLRPITEN